MLNGKKIYISFVILCVILAVTGCQKKKQAPVTSEQTASSDVDFSENEEYPRPLDKFRIKSEVVSPTAIKLKWKEIQRGDTYTITREHKTEGYKKEVVFQPLPREETSILDESLELGKNYHYTITTHCTYDELDRQWIDYRKLKPILKANLFFHASAPKVSFDIPVSEIKKMSSSEITLQFKIGDIRNHHYWLPPTGIEIYRGKREDSCKKIAEEILDHETKYDVTEEYIDRDVAPREDYYYQLRTFVEMGGGRLYGKMTEPIKLSAKEQKGKYRVKILTKKGESVPALQLALIGKKSGNKELFLDRTAMKCLVDYIYRKKDEIYASVRLKLNRYRREGGGWKNYRGEQLSILGRKRIDLEFVAEDGITQLPYPSKEATEAEILFHGEYDERWFQLHMDLVNQKVSMKEEIMFY